MNDKITFPRLSALLADKSGRSKRFSEDFLRDFFALISETLEAGESVKVKGLGTFRLTRVEPRKSVDVTTGQPMEISGHSKVVFIPAKELAEAVNAPFEAFTAIEIGDEADLSQVFAHDEILLQQVYDETEEADSQDESDSDMAEESIVSETPEIDMAEEATTAEETSTEKESSAEEEDSTEEDASMDEDAFTEEETLAGGDASKEEESAMDEDSSIEEDASSTGEDADELAEKPQEHAAMEDEDVTYVSEVTEIESEAETESEPTDTDTYEVVPVEVEAEYDEEYLDPKKFRKKSWKRILLISLGAALFALVATFAVWYFFATNDFNKIFNRVASNTPQTTEAGFEVTSEAPSTDSIAAEEETEQDETDSETAQTAEEPEVPTAPSDALVYDTVSTTRYLTTIAKAHYGNYNLWPFIYEENKSILGHPDRIRPGTPVVVPKLSKYGIDPAKKEDVEKAKKMGVEIYARYGKKI